MTASTVSERIEALLRPPVDSSPRPSLTCSPTPMRAADLGQRAGVDDRGAQLGQPALGEVRVGPVERLGHDDAEHRVAQELQALVGRQAAVLVGVRPVGEGALEQLGIQLRIPERCSQLAVVGQRTGIWLRGPDDGRRGRRTGRTRRTHGAAGAWHRRRGSRRSPGSARRPSTRATVTRVAARHLPLRDSHCSLLYQDRDCPAVTCYSGRFGVAARARSAPPNAGRSQPRARGRGRRPDAPHTRGTVRDSRPRTAAGTVVRAPPRPAAGARGRAGRPRAC